MKRTRMISVFVISLIILFSSGCSRINQESDRNDNDREESASASKDDESEIDSDGTIKLDEPSEPEPQEVQATEKTAEAAEPAQSTEAAPAESDFILPNSDTIILTYEDIADLTIEEIPYARNEIYARHGYPFQKESYIEYFGSKDWYRINPDFKESDLSEIEKTNVEFLKGYEQR